MRMVFRNSCLKIGEIKRFPGCTNGVHVMNQHKKLKRNKVFLSAGLFIASAMFMLSQFTGNTVSATAIGAGKQSAANTASAQAVQTASMRSNTSSSGLYADGTYTGSATDAYYGTVQVKAVIQNGKLATVQFLQYPSDRSTSRYINGQAMPALTTEAIQAQSANVNIVSGATFTSQAFQQSLQSALASAHA